MEMKVAKQIDGTVVIDDITVLYPNTSFAEDGPSPDFVEQEGIYFVDNNLSFDPTTQKLADTAPYIDGAIARSKVIVPLTQAELDQMALSKSGQVIDDFKKEASRRLDEFAQSRGYDNIISLTTYVTDANPDYVAEAQRGVYLRSQWWSILTAILNDVLAGTRPLPATFDDLADELPSLTWTNARPA